MRKQNRFPPVEDGIEAVPIPDGIEVLPTEKQQGISTLQVRPDVDGKEVFVSDAAKNRSSTTFIRRLGRKGIFCLGLLVIVCLALVIGLTVGLLHAKSQEDNPKPSNIETATPSTTISTIVSTTFIDVSPVPSNSFSLTSLPTGTFTASEKSSTSGTNNCLDSTIRSAWSCQGIWNIEMVVGQYPQGRYNLSLPYLGNGSVIYGAQPPVLSRTPYTLTLEYDKRNVSAGPALFFWDYFDKIVIIPESELPRSSRRRRDANLDTRGITWTEEDVSEAHLQARSSRTIRRQIGETGEKPWFCVWNATVIEAFIFVNQTTSKPTNEGGLYPKPVLFKETRRSSNAVSPYCQQFQILNDGTTGPLMDDNGNPIMSYIAETEMASSNCSCQWFIG